MQWKNAAALHLSRRERSDCEAIRVRGYGLTRDLNPLPVSHLSMRDDLPFGRGEAGADDASFGGRAISDISFSILKGLPHVQSRWHLHIVQLSHSRAHEGLGARRS